MWVGASPQSAIHRPQSPRHPPVVLKRPDVPRKVVRAQPPDDMENTLLGLSALPTTVYAGRGSERVDDVYGGVGAPAEYSRPRSAPLPAGWGLACDAHGKLSGKRLPHFTSRPLAVAERRLVSLFPGYPLATPTAPTPLLTPQLRLSSAPPCLPQAVHTTTTQPPKPRNGPPVDDRCRRLAAPTAKHRLEPRRDAREPNKQWRARLSRRCRI